MDQDRFITAAAGGAPGSAEAGAGADRAAGHDPIDQPPQDTGNEIRQQGAGPADRREIAAAGRPEPGQRSAAVYRTPNGWRVGEEELPDLVSAMVFADLLVSELPAAAKPVADGAGVDAGAEETARLKMTIAQLEHALAHRVRVEQAIGVLAERHRLPPRQAFEMLRTAARSRGRRVQELADEVVTNVTNPLLPVAEELARPPATPRARGRRPTRPGRDADRPT